LLEVWDPTGIRRLGGPDDEYDSYLTGIAGLLIRSASDEQIARHLCKIVSDSMGYDMATVEEMMPTVTALRRIQLPSA
jgi:hypothetical protein